LTQIREAHAARGVACHGVRSHPVPVALVGECSIPVVENVARQPRSWYCVSAACDISTRNGSIADEAAGTTEIKSLVVRRSGEARR
jgi:hypothetical protein